MAHERAERKYEDLSIELVGEHDGVSTGTEGLFVRGTLFAFLVGDDLVVDVPDTRATDLVKRGVAARYVHDGHPDREWVRVGNLELWAELAREAHEHVGEPAVGGDS